MICYLGIYSHKYLSESSAVKYIFIKVFFLRAEMYLSVYRLEVANPCAIVYYHMPLMN